MHVTKLIKITKVSNINIQKRLQNPMTSMNIFVYRLFNLIFWRVHCGTRD